MEKGFCPDEGHLTLHNKRWHRGELDDNTGRGFLKGLRIQFGFKDPGYRVLAYRRPSCTRLEWFAIEEGDR